VLNGELSYEDTAGKRGEVSAGGIEWMKSGNGGWLEGHAASGAPLRVFQLWIALSPSETSSAAESEYIAPQELELDGAVGVLLGQFGRARSRIRGAPTGTNYFHVRLEDGQRWSYAAPDGHNVTWLAVDRGRLRSQQGERVHWGQIAVFGDSRGVIEMQADGETSLVLGSARRYPHPLVLGEYPSIQA